MRDRMTQVQLDIFEVFNQHEITVPEAELIIEKLKLSIRGKREKHERDGFVEAPTFLERLEAQQSKVQLKEGRR